MLALYGEDHAPACSCPTCTVNLADPLSVAWKKIPPAIVNDYLDAVYYQRITRTDLHEGLFRAYYDRLKSHAEAGWGKRFNAPDDAKEWERFQAIEHNLRDFAGHKQATLTEQLRLMLTDKAGHKLSRADWESAVAKTVKRYNDRYLRIETQMATQAAQAAESWQEFERRKYLYPNLRYETAGDERVRESHRALDGVVKPVDDPFWNVYYPPNGWGCRCKVIQTDESVTPDGDGIDFEPPKGFRGNVGKTGQVFGEDHPYFDQSALDKERIRENAGRLHAKISREDVRAWAKDAQFSLRLPNLTEPATMTRSEVKTVTGKPHQDAASRNELLYILSTLAGQLKYLGSAPDDGAHPHVKAWHYYSLRIGRIDYYLNVWRLLLDEGERLGIHAISDVLPDFGGP